MPGFKVTLSKDDIEEVMSEESGGKKCCIAISSLIHFAFAGVVGIIFSAWWSNQNKIENIYDGDGNFYDALPGYYYYHS